MQKKTCRFPGRTFRIHALAALVCLLAPAAGAAEPVTATFTDSHGRSLLYRYELPEGSNPETPQGVLIFFHGNNEGPQEQMLDWFFPQTRDHAGQLDFVPVTVASSGERPGPRGFVRQWYARDEQLVHEMLQSDFGGRFRVDVNRVFLWGGSQGACFLNDFVPRFGAHYGGGLLADCGCFNSRDPLWQPPEEFADRFRVFVRATTEDFLHPHSLDAYGYYRYTIGLDARGDLARKGEHCASGDVSDVRALNWLAHGTGLPDEEEHLHLERVSRMDFAVGFTADAHGALWIARQPPGEQARLWRSVDRGTTFYPVSRIGIPVSDLDAAGNALIATHLNPDGATHALYRSTDSGSTFEPVNVNGVPSPAATVADRKGRIFVAAYSSGSSNVYRSSDAGETWTSLRFTAPQRQRLVNTGPLVSEEDEDFLFTGDTLEVLQAGSTQGRDWSNVSASPTGGRIWYMAWDGEAFWALADEIRLPYRSIDRGSTWTRVTPPTDTFDWFAGTRLNALDHGQIFVLGSEKDGHLRNRGGDWIRVFGSGSLKDFRTLDHRIAFDHVEGDVYVTAGPGIFRLDGASRSIDVPAPRPDSDSDGIPDVLDAFEDDGSEYLDTDGDGIGNSRDDDDDGDGVHDEDDQVPLDPDETVDTDRDGIGDRGDIDDDGDGIRDTLDAFPLDATESVDSDGDGKGDTEDRDDDGDGVEDREDDFRLYPGEWSDTDGDGIGDNADRDDDGDGRRDAYDPAPTVGRPVRPGLRHSVFTLAQVPTAYRITMKPDGAGHVRYPAAAGHTQWFGSIEMGDGVHPAVHLMVDVLGAGIARVWFDRSGNSDLTDDGPHFDYEGGWIEPVFDIAYRSGAVVPYSMRFGYPFGTNEAPVNPTSNWRGPVSVVGGATVDVTAGDLNLNGVFADAGDYVCVDIDRDGDAGDCRNGDERFGSGDTFVLDGREVQVLVATSGHRVEIGSPVHPVPFFPAASHPDWQGFVQVTNRGDGAGDVEVHAFDEDGKDYGPLTLPLGALATAFFNSKDLEQGNPDKDLAGGTGAGKGAWRLELKSDLDLDVLSYVRTGAGFLTRMHDMAHRDARAIRVPTFNPGSNSNQVSLLRLVNPGAMDAEVTVEGIDDDGLSPGGPVTLSVPAGGAREVSAEDLEAGGGGLTGALGDGKGKWRLAVTSDGPVRALSLLQSPTGHVTNLSTQPYEDGGPLHQVSMFPAASDPVLEGFARVVNRSDEAGEAMVFAYDDDGAPYGPLTLAIAAGATVHFNSKDLEQGNASKGLAAGTGQGSGDWWLEFESELDLQVLGYIRTADGFLTGMHDAFHRGEGGIHVPTFNPGSNSNQVSLLRLVNPGDDVRRVAVTGVDGHGASPGSTVRLSVPPRGARTLTSAELETGMAPGLTGALGDGEDKWQFTVEPDGPLRVLSLLRSPTGHLTNLSTMPERFPSRELAAELATGTAAGARPDAEIAPLDVKRAGVAVAAEPNVIVVDTETMGRIHFDLGTLAPEGSRITGMRPRSERLR